MNLMDKYWPQLHARLEKGSEKYGGDFANKDLVQDIKEELLDVVNYLMLMWIRSERLGAAATRSMLPCSDNTSATPKEIADARQAFTNYASMPDDKVSLGIMAHEALGMVGAALVCLPICEREEQHAS